MSDLVPLNAFPNDTAAQVAAAALRHAGLHPVVLGHDPLAQLFDPARAARMLVPEEELEAAREVLDLIAADAPDEGRTGGSPLPFVGTLVVLSLLLIAYTNQRRVTWLAALAFAAWLYLRHARRKAIERMER